MMVTGIVLRALVDVGASCQPAQPPAGSAPARAPHRLVRAVVCALAVQHRALVRVCGTPSP